MSRAWRLFSTVFTAAGVVAILAGVFLVRTGKISLEASGAARVPEEAAPREEKPAAEPSVPEAASPPAVSEAEVTAWRRRMGELLEQVRTEESAVARREEALAAEQARIEKVSGALAALLGEILGEDAPAPEVLRRDAQVIRDVVERIAKRTARAKRVPELVATLAEMTDEDAAVLIGQSLPADLGYEILEELDTETRGAILGMLVRKNPDRAGELFTRLAGGAPAGEEEEG
jgi:flagellar motility protein MotE (MotC chaperone)